MLLGGHMLTFHAMMPFLSLATFRRLEMSWYLSFAALSGLVAYLFGPDWLARASIVVGGMLAMNAVAEVAMHRWARRHGLPLIPRRDWGTAWFEANLAATAPATLVRGLLLGVAIAQLGYGQPCWALDSQSGLPVILGIFFSLLRLGNRPSASVDARATAARNRSSESRRHAP
jgi:hypothetical protein